MGRWGPAPTPQQRPWFGRCHLHGLGLGTAPLPPGHPVGGPGEQHAHPDVDRRDHHHHGDERQIVVQVGRDQFPGVEELLVGDEIAERGVLQGDHQLADDGGQHGPYGLRYEDVGHDLGLTHAQRERGLPLPAVDGADAGAEDLGEHRAVVERQSGDQRGQRLHLQRHEDEEDHHQHGHGAEELDDQRGDPADRAVVGEASRGQQAAQRQREHRGEGESLERVAQSAQQELLDALVLEGRPLGVGELAGVEEEIQDPADQGEDQGGGHEPVHPVASPGPRPGHVVEGGGPEVGGPAGRRTGCGGPMGGGGHRATPQRFSRMLKTALMARVMIRYPTAIQTKVQTML